jgi:hypothetical protein
MNQTTFGEFSDDSPDLWDFDHYGPTADRPIPEAERSAVFMSGGDPVDRREIPDSGLSLSDITDWPHINREESHPNALENFKQKMSEIHDSGENSSETKRPDQVAFEYNELDELPEDVPIGAGEADIILAERALREAVQKFGHHTEVADELTTFYPYDGDDREAYREAAYGLGPRDINTGSVDGETQA